MSSPFAEIIAGLEKAGAFREVLGVPGLYPGYVNDRSDGHDAREFQRRHRATYEGLKIYLPLDAFLAFSRGWLAEAASNPIAPAVLGFMIDKMHRIQSGHEEYQQHLARGHIMPPLRSEPGYGLVTEKTNHAAHSFMKEIFQHHPEIFHTFSLIQTAHLAFMDKVQEALSADTALSPSQREIAARAIRELSADIYRAEYVDGACLWTAVTYYDRITKNRTVLPDYSQPIIQSDFAEGWDKTINRGGMVVDSEKAGTGQSPRRVCPAFYRAERTAGEICALDGTDDLAKRTASLGFGSWCLYQMLIKPEAKALHAENYARLNDPLYFHTAALQIWGGKRPENQFAVLRPLPATPVLPPEALSS